MGAFGRYQTRKSILFLCCVTIHYSQDILGVVARFCRPVTFRYAWHKNKLMKLASKGKYLPSSSSLWHWLFFFFLEKHNILVVVVFCFVLFLKKILFEMYYWFPNKMQKKVNIIKTRATVIHRTTRVYRGRWQNSQFLQHGFTPSGTSSRRQTVIMKEFVANVHFQAG